MKTLLNIYRYNVGMSKFADELCLIAAIFNGLERNFSLGEVERYAQMTLIRFPEHKEDIHIEMIGEDVLHFDKKNDVGEYQTFCRIEYIEIMTCEEAAELTASQARAFVRANPELGIPTLDRYIKSNLN